VTAARAGAKKQSTPYLTANRSPSKFNNASDRHAATGDPKETSPGVRQTGAPRIEAVGDVIGFPALASFAMEQGRPVGQALA